eukprot:scaffold54032_cov20-Tisochrysis_lutea.AAC.1
MTGGNACRPGLANERSCEPHGKHINGSFILCQAGGQLCSLQKNCAALWNPFISLSSLLVAVDAKPGPQLNSLERHMLSTQPLPIPVPAGPAGAPPRLRWCAPRSVR